MQPAHAKNCYRIQVSSYIYSYIAIALFAVGGYLCDGGSYSYLCNK